MSGEFLLISGDGQTYSEQEADEWLKPTKWRKLERKPLSGSNQPHCRRGDSGSLRTRLSTDSSKDIRGS